MNTSLFLSTQSFSCLDILTKKKIYQEANEFQDIKRVRQMNEWGMKPEVPHFTGPTFVSSYMDIATKHDIILAFFKRLRDQNRLLTEGEFQMLSDKKWILKYRIDRIMGCDFLQEIILEKQLKYMKVPLKILVVDECEFVGVEGFECGNNAYNISSDKIKVYSERITPVQRKLTRDEIDELIQLIAAANFTDIQLDNIILTKEGVYNVDTEFKSFSHSINWDKLRRIDPLIDGEDKEYFLEQIEDKRKAPQKEVDDNEYWRLQHILKYVQDEDMIKELKDKISRLEYVGAKESGSSSKPNLFSFALNSIL